LKSDLGLTKEDLACLNMELNKRYVLYRPHWLIRGLFAPYKHKRRLYRWFFLNTIKMILLEVKDTFVGKGRLGITGFMRLKKPTWYDS